MNHKTLPLLAAFSLAPAAFSQNVVHYWDFSSTNDVVGGVATTSVGTTDLSVNATYGEAYAGSGASLNSILGGTSAGGGHLSAAVQTGGMLQMDWGMDSFSFSYWTYDDFAGDSDIRGPRVFDCLDNTTVGIQLGTNATNDWNFRVDDDNGSVNIFNNVNAFMLPQDQWVHVAGVVDRVNSEIRSYVNGTLQATIPFNDTTTNNPMTGNVFPTIDLQIGAINGGTNAGQCQTAGLDDLAFYEGVLSAADVMDLASATKSPLDFASGVSNYCDPAVANSSGMPGFITATGNLDPAANNFTLMTSNLPNNQFGIFVTSLTQGFIPGAGGTSNGNICLGGVVGRFTAPSQILGTGTTGGFSLAVDLTAIPQANGTVTVMSGETWNFQAWHRDSVGLGSNFTNGVSVRFQ